MLNPLLNTYFALYSDQVRVRFAPSPTGWAHAGSIRTALYNYLFAKKHGGKFLLRIEDTDQERTVPGADKYILDSLYWLGIPPDEGWDDNSPLSENYRQSYRTKNQVYKPYLQHLVKTGYAYICFDTPDEIDAMRQRYVAQGITMPSYNYHTRGSMKNSLTLSDMEVNALLDAGTPHVIRFKFDNSNRTIFVDDLIRGQVEFKTDQQDDKILMKSDGMPTYHLANVVDDLEMGITHVIRGEEWLPSAALHVSLYDALGYRHRTPKFVHLPLILKPDGKGKLSKRDGIALGIPIFPFSCIDPVTGKTSKGYKEEGYLPQAILNHLSLIGWHPTENNQEIFSMDELINLFSFDQVNKSGARYDHKKLNAFNRHYLKAADNKVIAEELMDKVSYVRMHHIDYVIKVVDFMKDRSTFIMDIYDKGKFFFVDPSEYDMEFVKEKYNDKIYQFLNAIYSSFGTTQDSDFIISLINDHINYAAGGMRLDKTLAIQFLNIIMTGSVSAPNIANVISILGKNVIMDRFTNAIDCFSKLELKVN